jgi:acetolactate synthase-1/2/3 large subunit
VIVDVDQAQVFSQAVQPDLGIIADIDLFLKELLVQLGKTGLPPKPRWLEACNQWKEKYPIILDDYYRDREHVNSYVFMDVLSDMLTNKDIVVAGAGLDAVSVYQAFKVKPKQRTLISGNWGAMGWDLPLAIGACVASGGRRTICVAGDGSIQWNVQELGTVRYHHLPIHIFIFNNGGFGSIRATQKNLFDGHLTGADAATGVGNPDFSFLAQAYGLAYSKINTNSELLDGLKRAMITRNSICEVKISPDQAITPKASSFRHPDGRIESRPLEDMAPFLPREEVYANMHLFDDEDK